MKIRNENKLELPYKVRITSRVKDILRSEKKKQKKTMARIVCELIEKEYGNQ